MQKELREYCATAFMSLGLGSVPHTKQTTEWNSKDPFNVSLFSSDLVNGLVLLMNSNISSPVNLVSTCLCLKN